MGSFPKCIVSNYAECWTMTMIMPVWGLCVSPLWGGKKDEIQMIPTLIRSRPWIDLNGWCHSNKTLLTSQILQFQLNKWGFFHILTICVASSHLTRTCLYSIRPTGLIGNTNSSDLWYVLWHWQLPRNATYWHNEVCHRNLINTSVRAKHTLFEGENCYLKKTISTCYQALVDA